MIITRSPLRISLGGGGTDLPSYYERHGGFLIAAAIDSYVYVTVNRPFGAGIRLKYSNIENCDTVDDNGVWRCMYTGARPKEIAAAAETISAALGVRLHTGRLIPGILADSMAFANLGMEAVTLSRGTLSTLARIHTRRDNSNALTGSGSADAGALLSALAKDLG